MQIVFSEDNMHECKNLFSIKEYEPIFKMSSAVLLPIKCVFIANIRTPKIHICLCILAVRSESSLSPYRLIQYFSLFCIEEQNIPDPTVRMRGLICVFSIRIWPKGIFAYVPCSLIGMFTVCMFESQGHKVCSFEQEKERADAQRRRLICHRWAHTSEGTFSNVATYLSEAEWNTSYIDLNYTFPASHYIQGMSLESAMCPQTCKQKQSHDVRSRLESKYIYYFLGDNHK